MYEILFQYGPFTLSTFTVLLAMAFVVGMVFLIRFIQFRKLKLGFFVNHFVYLILFPLIGGRFLYAAEHFSVIKENPLSFFYVWDMGFSPFGIFYSALLTLYLLSRREHEDFWAWLDTMVLTGLSGLFFVHLGHFFKGSDYGKPTDLPWGISFDAFNIPYTTPIHPVQLYSALLTFLVFGLAMTYVKRTYLSGVVGTFAIMLYSLGAFGIDFLHGLPSAYAKISFLAISALAFIFYILCSHKKMFD
ncbi:prolipoprotein diacylglyceryl transferase [Candidatus Peregrinibacteria bacterium]|nr:prolipoprotein diacylglyceryl transferase [Candidatus Peregrinibacteria bacterium]